MSVIKRSDLITDEAVQWPDKYKKDLAELITTSKKLGAGTSKKNMTELTKVQKQFNVAQERSNGLYTDAKAKLNTLNRETREVTVTGPRGKSVTLAVPENIEGFEKLKVGDNVNARYIEAFAIAVQEI